jgi:hypothetical protein
MWLGPGQMWLGPGQMWRGSRRATSALDGHTAASLPAGLVRPNSHEHQRARKAGPRSIAGTGGSRLHRFGSRDGLAASRRRTARAHLRPVVCWRCGRVALRTGRSQWSRGTCRRRFGLGHRSQTGGSGGGRERSADVLLREIPNVDELQVRGAVPLLLLLGRPVSTLALEISSGFREAMPHVHVDPLRYASDRGVPIVPLMMQKPVKLGTQG